MMTILEITIFSLLTIILLYFFVSLFKDNNKLLPLFIVLCLLSFTLNTFIIKPHIAFWQDDVWIYSLIYLMFYLLLSIIVINIYKKIKKDISFKTSITIYVTITIVLLFIKIVIAYFSEGHPFDMECWRFWSWMTNWYKFNGMYYTNEFLDYPPLYMYILAFLEKIRLVLGWGQEGPLFGTLLKLPAILSDVLTSSLLFYFIQKHSQFRLKNIISFLLPILFLSAPYIIFDSSVWGQVDSILVLLLLITGLLLSDNKFYPACILMAISVAFKPQSLYFGAVFIYYLISKKKLTKEWILGPLLGLFTLFVIGKPFAIGFDYSVLIKKYLDTFSSYSYFSFNATNIYALVGLNNVEVPKNIASILTLCSVTISFLLGFYFYFKTNSNSQLERITKSSMIIYLFTFIFQTSMHERYLYPAVTLLLVLLIISKHKKGLIIPMLIISSSCFLNMAYIYSNVSNILVNDILLKLNSVYLITSFFLLFSKIKNNAL